MAEKKAKTEELLIEAKSFFDFYKKEVGKSIRAGKNVICISFSDLASFSHILSEQLLSSPEEVLQLLELALEDSGLVVNPRVRLLDLPETHFTRIRNIRAKHLNSLIWIEGIVRQASDVRPQVINAKFECPSCGTILSILQIEKKFREPSRCSCGRRTNFRLISKEMVDAQRLVIEENPESLFGGEQPRRISVFLKEDLVEPKMEEKTTPGSRLRVIGVLKEVPLPLQTGALSTRFDLALESNNLVPLEETYDELEITEEDERQIRELAVDPLVFEKLAQSIAPSIYGYEEIKRALVLQLFGGVKKTRSDGTQSRGDIHLLLVGDPGVAKSINKDGKLFYFEKNGFGYDSIEEIYNKFGKRPVNLKVLTIDMKKHECKWENVKEIIKHLPEERLIKITTEHGKEIAATLGHSFITLSKEGEIVSIKGENLGGDLYLPLPLNFHKELIETIETEQFNVHGPNSKQLPKKIKLDEDFGFFVGLFLSEGNIRRTNKGRSKTVVLSNKNKKMKSRVKKFIEKLNLEVNKTKREEVAISSKSLSNLLDFNCYDQQQKKKISYHRKGNYSAIKKIPDFAFFSPRNFIKGLISGLFSGDGRFVKDKNRLKGVELVTISRFLAKETSELLFSLGVINKVNNRYYTYKNKRKDYYIVSIPSPMLFKFLKYFRFYGRKILGFPKPKYDYLNHVPCGDLLYSLIKKLGYNKRIGGDRTFAAEMRTVRARNNIGKVRLKNILKSIQFKHKNLPQEFYTLKKIAYSDIVWSKILSVEKLQFKNEAVYDLNIPKTNTFVANGIGVHNSVTLKFMSTISPKGRYVSGKSTTGAGITATVVRDEFLRGWSLEAGALVLSNKGLVCIDELEKMDPEDRSAMHEALEQQTITISKANVQATLRAETSVLAAANPKFGRFDPYQPIAQQIDIPPTLLNRFDVIFTLRDLPDRAKDEAIATHVLLEHRKQAAAQIVERELFKKYIAYAKQKFSPVLSDEAVDEIKRFYVELRNAPVRSDELVKPIPISARQLEALIRLSEASAKTRLSSKVTKEDAKRAIELIKFYLTQVGYDYETKTFDIDKIVTGVTASQRNRIILVREALARLESRIGKMIPIEEIEKELEAKLDKKDVEEVLEKLTISGDIFHPRKNFVQRV